MSIIIKLNYAFITMHLLMIKRNCKVSVNVILNNAV